MNSDITLISFASPTHYRTQDELLQYKDYFSDIILYKDTDIPSEFREYYKSSFKYKKYFGYFIWKPFVLLDAFDKSKTSNVLYVDSNFRFLDIEKFLKIYTSHSQNIFIPIYNHYFNRDWTKRDCFYFMGCDSEQFWNANQVWSVIIGYEKDRYTMNFLTTLLHYVSNENIVTDNPNVCGLPNFPGFIEHRWDQSILSNMVKLYGYRGYPYNNLLGIVEKIYPQDILDEKASLK